jgi:hypothetical protein
MGKPSARYVAKSEADRGWRVWDRKLKRWWGEWRCDYPQAVLDELNGQKRPEVLTELCRQK